MVGDDLLCRFSESEVIVPVRKKSTQESYLARGSCILAGRFCGWWVRDGRRFTKELGRPDAELWSLVGCSVISLQLRECHDAYYNKPSDFLLMVKGDSFVPVKFEKTRCNPTGDFNKHFATTGRYSAEDLLDGVVVMHRHNGNKVPEYLSCVDWDGFGPSERAFVERVIERGLNGDWLWCAAS